MVFARTHHSTDDAAFVLGQKGRHGTSERLRDLIPVVARLEARFLGGVRDEPPLDQKSGHRRAHPDPKRRLLDPPVWNAPSFVELRLNGFWEGGRPFGISRRAQAP